MLDCTTSVHEPEEFWDGIWEHARLIGIKKGPTMVRRTEMPGAQFYPESLINFAENCLAHNAPENEIAIISYTETEAARSHVKEPDNGSRISVHVD